MRLLVVSNYYPPFFFGGYELGCRDVVEGLRGRGHVVSVLTSSYEAEKAHDSENVQRVLPLGSTGGKRLSWHLQSALLFCRAISRARPNVIYFWNQSGLSLWFTPLAWLLGFRCAFFLSDTAFVSWNVAAFSGGKGCAVIKKGRRHFASRFLQELARPNDSGLVIHWGIDPAVFTAVVPMRSVAKMRLLYLGQIIPEKGVHTLIDAVQLLRARGGAPAIHLTIVGGSSKPEYLSALQNSVRERGLEKWIDFAGKRERAELPALYRAHDVLVMPSIWDEPFAITPLEAMASGLPVVTTNTGGSAEIFRDHENALVFAAGNAEACAAAFQELHQNRELYQKIREAGRAMVLANFTLEKMVDRIESDLRGMIE